jgi:hypothetical protein
MPDATEGRKNVAPWWGFLFAIAALGCNVAFFVGSPAQRMFSLLSVFLAIVALTFLAVGLMRAFGQARVYRGKGLTVVLSVIAFLAAGVSGLAFVGARKIPSATEAPQVGQRVPDFALADTSGKLVSLEQLLGSSSGSPSEVPAGLSPGARITARKAVLLIFYRGYW